MDIKVQVKLIATKSNDIFEQSINQVANNSVKVLKTMIEKDFKSIECETHKKLSKGTITITAGGRKAMEIKKSNFCCNEFKNSINISD